VLGNDVWDWHEKRWPGTATPALPRKGQLTVTYLTDAHRACAQRISQHMRDCGFDEVEIDAVGNVVGRYHGRHARRTPGPDDRQPLRHRAQRRQVRRAPGHLRAHGLRARAAPRWASACPSASRWWRLPKKKASATRPPSWARARSSALQPEWLDQKDADGITMRAAMQHAGLCVDDIAKLQRDPAHYLGFVEVHIEQGPVLNELDLPLGVVTSINGSVRYLCEMIGTGQPRRHHAHGPRRDAAVAVAELALYVEQRAAKGRRLGGHHRHLNVPSGSINVVPGRCQFTWTCAPPPTPSAMRW
jgi:N-carbamoyl-L-amino-acid hydrolase